MIKKLVEKLKDEEAKIFIQTHNFPDPDAVASADGLQQLLKSAGLDSHITADGVIQKRALQQIV